MSFMHAPHVVNFSKSNIIFGSGGKAGGANGTSDGNDDDSAIFAFIEQPEDVDIGDPCHEFEHSVFFFLILVVSVVASTCYCVLLRQRLELQAN